jgi:hypothetical protein
MTAVQVPVPAVHVAALCCTVRPVHSLGFIPEPTVARSSIFFEAPKSASLTVPCLSMRMLAPLMSL